MDDNKECGDAVTTLPEKLAEFDRLWKLVQAAIGDLEACEKDDKYRIDMGTWHECRQQGREKFCAVCLAGSVMAQRGGVPLDADAGVAYGYNADTREVFVMGGNFDGQGVLSLHDIDARKYAALDCIRVGDLQNAVLMFYGKPYSGPVQLFPVDISPYEFGDDGQDQFKRGLEMVAKSLKSCDL